jgi:predicted permease
MTTIFLAIAPIFLLIVAGAVLRRFIIRNVSVWRFIEALAYYVLFPALLIVTLAHTHIVIPVIAPLLTVIIGSVLLVSCGLLVFRRVLGLDGPAFSSVVQGAIRYNTYVGFAVVIAVSGEEGLSLLAVIAAFNIPVVNVVSVYVLTRYATHTDFSWRTTVRELVRNPLILSSLAGLALLFSGTDLPAALDTLLLMIGKTSLVLGLLAVGAGLDLAAVAASARAMAAGSVLKLLVLPALVYGLGRAVGLVGTTAEVALIFAALPTASSAYILARMLGGDYRLMAGLITFQTIAAFFTIPLVLMLFGA